MLSPPCPFQLLRLPKLAEICNLAEQLANLGVLAGKVSGRFGIYACFVFSKGLSNISFKKYDERFETPVPRLLSPLAGVQLSAETERIKASQIPSITVTVPLRVGGVMLHHLVE